MPYIGRTPSAVPVTADDIPANSIDASKIIDGSIEAAEISAGSITNDKLATGIAASKLTGALPAISGANLTGINAVVVGATLPSPVSDEGSLFYKSDTDIFYISNGTQWNLVSNANPVTTGGTVTIVAIDEWGTFSYDLGTDFTDDVDTDAQLTYTLSSGTMPTGCTLPTTGNSAFTGTASNVASNTNYTWTIKATDTSGGTATQDYQQTINNVPLGSVSTKPASSAQAIIAAGDSTGNGTYWITWNGTVTEIYCDMSKDGGGWMQVGASSGATAWITNNFGLTNVKDYPNYGTYSKTGAVSNYWKSASGVTFSEMLFSTGNDTYWFAGLKTDFNYAAATTTFNSTASSGNMSGICSPNSRFTVMFRAANPEDPWINAGDSHGCGDNWMLWGEDTASHLTQMQANGGSKVFVR